MAVKDGLRFQGTGMTSARTRDRLVQQLRDQGIENPRVLEVIRSTPRHFFVDEALASRAYENTALPIGHNQTVSQPYVVARMTEAILPHDGVRRVLEVGTGSGYQTAVLSQLVESVFSIERLEPLYARARERLRQLGCRNVSLRYGDGFQGWPEKGPFDAILVTASPLSIPQPLLEQLAPGGRLVIPVGERASQELKLVVRDGNQFHTEFLDHVRFVPLLSGRE